MLVTSGKKVYLWRRFTILSKNAEHIILRPLTRISPEYVLSERSTSSKESSTSRPESQRMFQNSFRGLCISDIQEHFECSRRSAERMKTLLFDMFPEKIEEVERLRLELAKKEVECERLKKGYSVKGVGRRKEYVIINKKNSK